MSFPYNENTATVDITRLCGAFCDFFFVFNENENQDVEFTMMDDDSALNLTGLYMQFRVARSTPGLETEVVLDVLNADITVTTNVVTFSVDNSDIPEPGAYSATLIVGSNSDFDKIRVLAKGSVAVTESLFEDE